MVAVDLHARMLVSHPDWADGQPVRILNAHPSGGSIGVRYQDAAAHAPAHLVAVAPGFELTFISGGCQAGWTR